MSRKTPYLLIDGKPLSIGTVYYTVNKRNQEGYEPLLLREHVADNENNVTYCHYFLDEADAKEHVFYRTKLLSLEDIETIGGDEDLLADLRRFIMKNKKYMCTDKKPKGPIEEIEPLFKRKTEEELNALTPARIKAYYKAEQRRYRTAMPWCCEFHCDLHWKSDEQEKRFEKWHKYVMFVKAIMNTK